jgi:alanine dehydrogenase
MSTLRLGVVATSRKPHERRLPIHPRHVASIDACLRDRIILEHGYGDAFGYTDADLEPYVGALRTRAEIFAECDVVLLFKPTLPDFIELREGQTLWGCPHFAQDEKVTQASIDNRLNVIALEGMLLRSGDGSHPVSICPQMGEMAGYCSVQHALDCVGRTGHYGMGLSAAVIGYGSTGQGAVRALNARGITDVTLLTRRSPGEVGAPDGVSRGARLLTGLSGGFLVATTDGVVPLTTALADRTVIVNCVRQDTNAPQVFLTTDDLPALTPGTVIVDVSCDSGMGFSWAQPTSFAEPVRPVGNNVHYYAVDHSPSRLWDSATWVLSKAIMPYLVTVMGGERAWDADETVRRAVEIRHGVIHQPDILAFQHRTAAYPHPVR